MDQHNLPDPGIVDSLLGALDHHAFATLAVIMLVGLAVAWRRAGKKGD